LFVLTANLSNGIVNCQCRVVSAWLLSLSLGGGFFMSLVYKLGFLLGRLSKKSNLLSHTQQNNIVDVNLLSESKGVPMDVNELKNKAKNLMIERKWDFLLMDAYLMTKHFVAWSQRDDFDECLNVGVKNVKGIERSIDISYLKEDAKFICGEISGVNFQLGGVTDYSSMPDGDSFITTNIALFIDDKRVLAARYTMDRDEAYFADDYSLLSVEEFHSNDSIEPLLLALNEGKKEQERKSKERERLENEQKYKGKFSF
jgi:hypothetical protein